MTTSRFIVTLQAFILAAANLAISSDAQTAAPPPASNASQPTPQTGNYQIIEAGANHRVWQRIDYETLRSGKTIPHIHKYTELATGLNHLVNGQWVESKEEIDILPDGNSAAATNGQHQVYFPGDIAQGVIELDTPDGLRLQSRPIGLGYDDGTKSVLIAVLTNSTGAILPSGNQVVYQNAFAGLNGFACNLLYIYTKSCFEQDVVILTEPPTPESLGLNPATAKLQVLTEFFNAPTPTATTMTLPAQAGVSVADQNLDFGVMKIGMGRAFTVGDNADAADVLVGKQWVQVGNRQILVEEAPVGALANQLGTLPLPQGASVKTGTAVRLAASRQWPLPPPHPAQAGEAGQFKRMAAATSPQPGLVLDYQTINSSMTNYTFRGDTTYYISGAVYLYRTNTIEGGAVLKYAHNASINLNYSFSGPTLLNWLSTEYRPVIFTAKGDDAVGEIIFGSLGRPSRDANPVLSYPWSVPSALALGHFRMANFQTGITFQADNQKLVVSDAQFVSGNCAINASGLSSPLLIGNALFTNLNTAIQLWEAPVVGENLTFAGIASLATPSDSYSTWLYLTNCILANVTNLYSSPPNLFTGSHNGFYKSPAFGDYQITNTFYPFQTAGGGRFYLTNGCNFFSQGTTNIDSTLLASLKTKTTHPPIVFAEAAITNNLVFSPQVPRDTNNNPDLGYHYDPIDYAVSGVSLNNAIAAVYPGTVIAAFGTGDNAFGLNLGTGTKFLCKGLATSWNRIVAYNTVQEQSGTAWQAPTNGLVTDASGDSSSSLDCRFTDWSVPAQDEAFLAITNSNAETSVALRDCQFHGGSLVLDYISAGDPAINNCLFERVNLVLNATLGTVFSVQNNLFWHGTFNFAPTADDSVVQNNLFDQTAIPDNSSAYGTYIGGYNAYVTNCDQLQPPSANDLVTNPPIYRVGPLGNYYQPTNSPLINAGSTNADALGLYDYTVLTNLVSGQEIKETNSIVDIGYHYVAVDSNGVPLTIYTNGLPDYLVTSSTDPIPDWWEFVYFGNLDQATNGDYDNDGTNNLTEYQNGVDPNKISFSFSFPNQYVNTNIVTAVITILGGVPSSMAMLVDPDSSTQTNWTAYTSPNITINLGSTQGPHDVWIGLRGLPANAHQTWEETTLVLDSTSPGITITNPANGVSFNASRVNVSGNFTAASLRQITVNNVVAFVNGTTFEARNVPLAAGANTLDAIVENLTGVTNAASITVTGTTNTDGSMNDPVQLQATPVAGFAPLQVVFQITSNSAPGTIQQVIYDFNGDDIADLVTNNPLPLTYTYATNGEYFPVVTIQTAAGRFSSIGGWNAVWLDPSNQPIRINVQSPPTQATLASVTDPVDLKWDGTHLYVLSGSSAAIYEFATNGDTIRWTNNIGSTPSGLDVDGAGNVYVAVNGNNQVWKFNPTDNSFQADTNFGIGGCIGSTNGTAGSATNEFDQPFDVAVAPDGQTISVSDSGNHRIQQFSAASGAFVASFGIQGSAIGQFNTPKGLTYDSYGTLYIVDSGNNRIVLVQDSAVMDVTGSGGTGLGQFGGPVNISIGERGVYVADTGNNRVQIFDPLASGQPPPLNPRLALADQFTPALNQPNAVAAGADLLQEKLYIADSGNNRVLLVTLPAENPEPVWNAMKASLVAGDIAGAVQYFSAGSSEDYRQGFLAIGTSTIASHTGQIGVISPVFIEGDEAQYRFDQVIEGVTITFLINFTKENGVWKIMDY